MNNMKEPTLKEMKELVSFSRNVEGKLKIDSIYDDVLGDVLGHVEGNIVGDVGGDVGGAVFGDVCRNVWGNVGGDVCRNVEGTVGGDVFGDVEGSVLGSVEGDVKGDVWDMPKVPNALLEKRRAFKARRASKHKECLEFAANAKLLLVCFSPFIAGILIGVFITSL